MDRTRVFLAAAQSAGLLLGPALALLCYAALPSQYNDASGQSMAFTTAGRATLAIMVWMAVWWLSNAVDISVTALLPLALFPLLGAADMSATAAPYADPLIFLFMAGFLFALSMQRWGLGQRIALVTLRIVGTRPANMIAGFMLATSILSAFVSNTATTALMLPIAMSVVELVRREGTPMDSQTRSDHAVRNFGVCLMLGVAYSASIGGIATIVGTPPNAFLVAFVRESIDPSYRTEISFARWLLIGLPFTVVFLPVTFVLLTKVLYPLRLRPMEGGTQLIRSQLQQLGAPNRGEWTTLIVFLCTALLWITRPLLANWTIGTARPLGGLTDPGIAMTGALILFLVPVNFRHRQFVLDWKTAQQLPWGILILFGGGLSLASAVQANGAAEFLASRASLLAGMPDIVLVVAVTASVIFLTELTSNIATTAALVPVLAGFAPGLGVHPYLLVIPATIAASCAFMLPVATPPNAIVLGPGHIATGHMARTGFWLNIAGIVVITALTMLVIRPVMGLS